MNQSQDDKTQVMTFNDLKSSSFSSGENFGQYVESLVKGGNSLEQAFGQALARAGKEGVAFSSDSRVYNEDPIKELLSKISNESGYKNLTLSQALAIRSNNQKVMDLINELKNRVNMCEEGRVKEMTGTFDVVAQEMKKRMSEWDWESKEAGINETTLPLDSTVLPADRGTHDHAHSADDSIGNTTDTSNGPTVNLRTQQVLAEDAKLKELVQKSGLTLDDYLKKFIEKAKSEGYKDDEIDQFIQINFATASDSSKRKVAEQANSSVYDILDSLEVFYKRLVQLFSTNKIKISENELLKAEEMTDTEGDQEYPLKQYSTTITIPGIKEIFSSILNYPINVNESDWKTILDTLILDTEFEKAIYLIFSNSKNAKVERSVGGETIPVIVEQAFFEIDKISEENDSLIITVKFSVQ